MTEKQEPKKKMSKKMKRGLIVVGALWLVAIGLWNIPEAEKPKEVKPTVKAAEVSDYEGELMRFDWKVDLNSILEAHPDDEKAQAQYTLVSANHFLTKGNEDSQFFDDVKADYESKKMLKHYDDPMHVMTMLFKARVVETNLDPKRPEQKFVAAYRTLLQTSYEKSVDVDFMTEYVEKMNMALKQIEN
jgi:hypothetical protein